MSDRSAAGRRPGIQEGVHPRVVQERLGHTSISITLDVYSHLLPSMQEEAAAKIGAGIFEPHSVGTGKVHSGTNRGSM